MNNNIKKRLTYTKYIYRQGVDLLAKRTSISTAMACLSFQDAAEQFLMIVADKLRFEPPHDFLVYWERAEKKGTLLPYKTEMAKLNRMRVSFKHHGIPPPYDDCKDIQYSLSNFFDIVSRDVLNENYADVSLGDIVEFEDIRSLLKNAETYLGQEKFEKSIVESAKAFGLFEKKAQGDIWFSHIIKEDSFDSVSSSFVSNGTKEDMERKKIQRRTDNRLTVLTRNVNVLLLGIDAYKYRKFKQLTPGVNITGGGKFYLYSGGGAFKNDYNFNYENASFCINFVVDTILKYQESTFGLFNRNIAHTIKIKGAGTRLFSYLEGKFSEIGIIEKGEIFENAKLTLVQEKSKDYWRVKYKDKEAYIEVNEAEWVEEAKKI
jgi:hypothetical protein